MAIWQYTSFVIQMQDYLFPRGWIELGLAGLKTNRFLEDDWDRLVYLFPCFSSVIYCSSTHVLLH